MSFLVESKEAQNAFNDCFHRLDCDLRAVLNGYPHDLWKSSRYIYGCLNNSTNSFNWISHDFPFCRCDGQGATPAYLNKHPVTPGVWFIPRREASISIVLHLRSLPLYGVSPVGRGHVYPHALSAYRAPAATTPLITTL